MTKLALPLIVLTLIGVSSTAFADRAIPLHIAIEKGLVDVTVNGRGSSSGDSVQVTVQRGTRNNVRVAVLPGTVIESKTGDVQNMTLGGVKYEQIGNAFHEADVIELNDDKQHVFILQGFCRDFEKPTPQSQNTFNVSAPDASDTKILLQAAKLGASSKLTQAAIWIQRSGVSDEQLRKTFPVTQEEIDGARSLLVSIESPETTVDVQVLIDKLSGKIGDRLAELREKRAARREGNDERPAAARSGDRLRSLAELEVFDKIKVAIGN